MTVKQLEASLDAAFNEHCAALESGIEHRIQAAWNRYARAKNAYLEAYHSGAA